MLSSLFISDKGSCYIVQCKLFTEFQEILSLRKGKGLKYSIFGVLAIVDKNHGCHMEGYQNFTALSKGQWEILEYPKKSPALLLLKTTAVYLDFRMFVLSSVPKISDIKSPNPSKAGIFPNVCLFPSKARKIIKNIKQKLVNVEIQNFEKSFKMHVQWWEMLIFQCDWVVRNLLWKKSSIIVTVP